MKAFFAYPGQPTIISQTIAEGVSLAARNTPGFEIEIWERNDITGKIITAPILSKIADCDLFIADITRLNFNVTYEIGVAIGSNKRIILVRNNGIVSAELDVKKIGIFDTLGYANYENSEQLSDIITKTYDKRPINIVPLINKASPLFLIETPIKTDSMTRITARVKKSRLRYRSFSPSEDPRMAASFAIEQVANSIGVIVPIVGLHERDSEIHNIRAAFVAGLAVGMRKIFLILEPIDGPVFLDTRDITKYFRINSDIDALIADFAVSMYNFDAVAPKYNKIDSYPLAELSIGDPMAENEFTTLSNYYIKTDAFTRTLRGEVNVVVGRKGTGKTALFSQVRDKIRNERDNIVVDLKPEGYQLIKLREEIFNYLSEGARSHLIVVFWEYLLYLEIAYKLLEKDEERHLRDNRLYSPYVALAEKYRLLSPAGGEGDFSERLLILSDQIVMKYKDFIESFGATNPDITRLLRTAELRELRVLVSNYLKFKESVWILFDNLDKGWTSGGISSNDIISLRCLIDASRKIQREMQRDRHEFHAIVFVRNDIYQYLVRTSPDFGKEIIASLDWTDRDLLRQMLKLRLNQKDVFRTNSFEEIWSKVCCPLFQGQETSDFFIDVSMMRPRNLLKIFSYCRGIAVNMSNKKITEDDIRKGLSAYSNDILAEADREIKDLCPEADGLLYKFLFEKTQYKNTELIKILESHKIPSDKTKPVVEYLLFFGFFGILAPDGVVYYIYDIGYDMRKMKAIMDKDEHHTYLLNEALLPSLHIKW